KIFTFTTRLWSTPLSWNRNFQSSEILRLSPPQGVAVLGGSRARAVILLVEIRNYCDWQRFQAECRQYGIDHARSQMTNQSIGDWIHRRQIKSAGRIAVTAGERELTYEQLGERINRLANALVERGVQPGERVAYLGENSVEFLETLFAL